MISMAMEQFYFKKLSGNKIQSFVEVHLLPNALSHIMVKMIVKFELFKACQPPLPLRIEDKVL